MSDIVERLHEHDWQLGRSIAYEAAAEIERLRKMLWEVNEQCPEHVPIYLLKQICDALGKP